MSDMEIDTASIDGDLDIVQQAEANVSSDNAGESDTNENGDTDKSTKKRVTRRPQILLNAERLKTPRGLTLLLKTFENVRFKGRGNEKEDLSLLMKHYEYWCHRLYPKYPFDDCIEKLEKLGTKKPVQTYLKKIRMDMITDESENKELANNDNDSDSNDSADEIFKRQPPPQQASLPEITVEQLERIRLNKEQALKRRQDLLRKNNIELESHRTSSALSQRDDLQPDNSIVIEMKPEEPEILDPSPETYEET